jgi:hypothetical protein
MHTATAARRLGLGRAMLGHLIGVARERGYQLLSLETGSMDGFAPARALYASAGFTDTLGTDRPAPWGDPLTLVPVWKPPNNTAAAMRITSRMTNQSRHPTGLLIRRLLSL